MILYFSGTGNSEYAAKRIGAELGEKAFDLFDKIRHRDCSRMHSDGPWIIAVPTYAWRIPRIVQDWLEKTDFTGNRKIYFVMTCGDGIGHAGKYLKKLCGRKKLEYMGCRAIVMPENYIALFSTPSETEALDIIRKAESIIDETALLIQSGRAFPAPAVTLQDRLTSGIVNEFFYPVIVHARNFRSTDACISCGKCAAVCPLNNIGLENGRPVWGKNCTHCMACICRCPAEAIEYGKHSKGQARYVCPKQL